MWISTEFNRLKQPIVNILENTDPTNNFVALDIDATVLRVANGRTITPELSGLFVRSVAEANNIGVVYITARQDTPAVRQITLDALAEVGITDPPIVVLRPQYVNTWGGISRYKANAREYIEAQTNSRCVMNVGDQWSDLMPTNLNEMDAMRHTFDDQNILFSQNTGGVERWSVKLRE